MTNWRKGYTFLLMGLMITSGLVAFAAPAIADYEVTLDFALIYENAWQEPSIEPPDTTTRLIYNWDDDNGKPYWLGDTDTYMRIGISNLDTGGNPASDDMTIVEVTLSCSDGAILDIVGDDGGTDNTDDSIGTIVGDAMPNSGFSKFYFDVSPNAALGQHEIQIKVDYDKDGNSETDTGVAYIYISSIFDDTSTEDDHESLADLDETTGAPETTDFGRFEAGDLFTEGGILLHNWATDITDLSVTLTPPSDGDPDYIEVVGDNFESTISDIHGEFTGGALPYENTPIWRFDILPGTPPDEYTSQVDITFHRNGQDINEGTRDVYMEVGYGFANQFPTPNTEPYSKYQCRATSVTITDDGEGNTSRQVDVDDLVLPYDTYEQSGFSDKKITLEVVIENNGNSPIYNAEFVLDPAAWPNFRNPRFYWVSAGTLDYDSISVTDIDLVIGGTVTFVIEVIVVKEIPIGEHRLPIYYDGFYYNDGALGAPTGYDPLNLGDGVVGPDANDLDVLFSIFVTDSALDCHVVPPAFAGDKDDLTSEVITVGIVNDEGYTFIDIIVTADFTGTPFYAPLIDSTTLDWPVPTARNYVIDATNANMYTPFASWAPTVQMDVTFLVDTDPNMVPDRYPFSLTITAIIRESLVQVTTTVTVGAEIDYAGYGPRVYITGFTTDDIVPGDYFDLVLTIENQGDDTLRDVWVIIPPDGTDEYDWHTVGSEWDFKQQFDWSNVFSNWGNSSFDNLDFPSEMFYTMESLDVDNIREIIEINLYIEGVYSNPGSTINLIHIIDLAPGASFEVPPFTMIADKDMVNGKPYNIAVNITGRDSEGEPYWQNQTLEVMTSLPGDHYNPVELDWFTAGMKALALFLFFVIILAILLLVYNRFKGEPGEEEEEEFDFEDEPGFEETPEPAAPESPPTPPAPEELV
ncbi:MAG: hypothetical protein KAX31_04125, partial [Thermoplasmata archaeon]|nr:hypothetical protein [Thermoplasmata archaeon]